MADAIDPGRTGGEMHALIASLFPVCRSITGDGVRDTLRRIRGIVPFDLHEVPSGTRVFDWTVPREWNVREAWVKGPDGKIVVDFGDSNLHLVGYSIPFHGFLSLEELRPHLHALPDQPGRVPYRTSYYKDTWGFCLSQSRLDALRPGRYEVLVDSTLGDGSLTYGEVVYPGTTDEEVLVWTHCCHPSLCNDNLSGIAVATWLARTVGRTRTRYTYRFVLAPATIGAITWLARNEANVDRIRHGLVLANAGDAGPLTYKRSRRATAEIDRAATLVLGGPGVGGRIRDFSPYGYDERQFCSPGFDLSVGSLTRTPHGEYPEYHTSGDDLTFVRPEALADTFRRCLEILEILEGNRRFVNLNPRCEPQLGRRGLYGSTGGQSHAFADQMAMLWVLNLSDGDHALLDVAERSGMPFHTVRGAAAALEGAGLLRRKEEPT